MAYPAGIITRPVNFGPAFELEDGDTAGMQVTFKATRDGVLWMATGSPAISVAITRNADDGAEQTVDLPVTDQDGWGDGDGNEIIPGEDGHVFLYIATVIFTQDGRTIPGSQPRSKVVAIPQGDGSPLDLDKLIPLTSPGGTVVSVPDIWSEQIAQAEAAALAAAGAVIDSAAFVGSEIATTGTPAEVAVTAKNAAAVMTAPLSHDGGFPLPVRSGEVLLTRAQTGLPTIYWPWIVDVRHIAGRLGDYYLYYSTDHDSAGSGTGFDGKGGLGMAYADHPEGPWTVHTSGGSPVVYQDTVVGDQTETPSVIWNEAGWMPVAVGATATLATSDTITLNGHGLANGATVRLRSIATAVGVNTATTYYVRDATTNTFKLSTTPTGGAVDITTAGTAIVQERTGVFHIFYQQQHTGLNQSTLLLLSRTGLLNDPLNVRVGLVIQGVAGRAGDGQTSYFYPMRVGNTWHGSHLQGGGDFGRQTWSSSNDGVNFVTDPRSIGRNTDLVSDPNARYMVATSRLFRWRGRLWVIGGEATFDSGFISPVTGRSTWMVLPIADDLTTVTGKPFPVVLDAIAGETSRNTPTSFLELDGVIYGFYRASGATGHLACIKIGA